MEDEAKEASSRLQNPCGKITLRAGIYNIVVGEGVFAIIMVISHIMELTTKPKLDENEKGFLAIYIFISCVTALKSVVLFLGVRKNIVRKCHFYLVCSSIMFLVTIVTLIVYACMCSTFFPELVLLPLWLLAKIYCMWVVRCFIVQLIRENSAARMKAGPSIRVPSKKESYANTMEKIRKHGFETLLEELNFNPDDEIFMNQLVIDYNQRLLTDDNFAVSKGVIAFSDGSFSDVAIKIFKPTLAVTAIKNMISEAKILAMLRGHENFIKFYGICIENIHKGKVIVVLEFCPKGHLENFLRMNQNSFVNQLDEDEYVTEVQENLYENIMATNQEKFTSIDILRWSFELAKGMDYLHRKLIIHGNLATKHLIIDDNSTIKISQFTVAANLYNAGITATKNDVMTEPFPWRWMAIECMENIDELNFTEKSDVWAYGVTVWEMFSMAKMPYDGMSASEFFPKIRQGYRLEKPLYASTEVYDIMKNCWNRDLKERPTFSRLSKGFGDMVKILNQPTQEN